MSLTSALDCASGQPGNELPLEDHEYDEGRNSDDYHICEKQIPLRAELTDKAEQCQLRRNILRAGKKIERPREIVKDGN